MKNNLSPPNDRFGFKPVERAIDEYLGRRCMSVGYHYGEIVRAMMCNFFCGGDRTEDINIIKERVGYGPGGRLYSPRHCVANALAVDCGRAIGAIGNDSKPDWQSMGTKFAIHPEHPPILILHYGTQNYRFQSLSPLLRRVEVVGKT